ncbi:aldehyde dehydrogenase family protein [Actinomadura rugatobispora]|uniref:aldehyde dehydrogenase (NAD(+)) n=1 Tax=Actinomadura rugatobispora TaxID=1994 RepID=A0ABW0ZPW9_9ACTN|nr:aldehyde dehydrogenase family protein [Actinomadura rugatobispora]
MTATTEDAREITVDDRAHIYLDGKWVEPTGEQDLVAVTNSGSGEVLAKVAQASMADVDRAVQAARLATERWSSSSVAERAALLERLADEIEARADEIACTVALEVGTPLRMSRLLQVGLPLSVLRGYAADVRELELEQTIGNSLVHRTPVGVVGAITPWNYPLHQIAAKLGAAIAAGCGTVLKPANVAPLSAFILAEAADAAGVPAGLLNVVTGEGPGVGEAIAGHRDVGIVSFTGSTRAGARVAAVAAANITKVALELGGKSASIIAEDADLTTAVKASVRHAFTNSGQTCTAWTRMIVPRSRLVEVDELVAAEMAKMPVTHPLAEGARLGPLASAAQKRTVEDYLEVARAEGLREIARGSVDDLGHEGGYYVAPVAYSDVPRGSRLAQEEIFGPVLVIVGHDGIDDAVAIANDSDYGLAGGVWSADEERAVAIAKRIRTGQIDINGARFNPRAPFGGFGRSGIGRELGRFGIEEFLEVSAIQQ